MTSRLPSALLLAFTLLVGAQLAVAQVHCNLPQTADGHDCALCHTGKLQAVDTDAPSEAAAPAESERVVAESVSAPPSRFFEARPGRAPPSFA